MAVRCTSGIYVIGIISLISAQTMYNHCQDLGLYYAPIQPFIDTLLNNENVTKYVIIAVSDKQCEPLVAVNVTFSTMWAINIRCSRLQALKRPK